MPTKYDDAVIALYRAPLDKFVAERKRLAFELKAGGDKAGATRLVGLARPPISAWTVNQLWWEARETFDELLAAGERLRQGDLAGTGAHRDAMTKLRTRAETLLGAAGHATTEAMLRRIMTDLSALAAVGSFEPDPAGALTGDREPPGFDVIGVAGAQATQRGDDRRDPSSEGRELADAKASKEAEAARLRRERLEQERRVERTRVEAALQSAKARLETRTHEVDRLRNALAEAEKTVAQTRADIADLESRLAGLD